jgi:hypothetical protein
MVKLWRGEAMVLWRDEAGDECEGDVVVVR